MRFRTSWPQDRRSGYRRGVQAVGRRCARFPLPRRADLLCNMRAGEAGFVYFSSGRPAWVAVALC